MNSKRESSEHLRPIKGVNRFEVLQDNDKIITSERHNEECIDKEDINHKCSTDEPKHSRIPGVKSLGEILQSNFKSLFERRYNDE